MSRHVDDIKNMIFDQPEFESDDDEYDDHAPIEQKKSTVETIVFRDRSKMKKNKKLPNKTITPEKSSEEFDLEKARFDVHKFGIKGFEKSKYEDARVDLAVSLGAKPPKRKFINYRELKEQNRANKTKEKEDEENARLLGDLWKKTPKKNQKYSKQKRIGQGEVGSMRFSSVGKFRGGMLKISQNDISKVKQQSKTFKKKK